MALLKLHNMQESLYHVLMPTKEHPWQKGCGHDNAQKSASCPSASNWLMNEVAMEAKTETTHGPSGRGSLPPRLPQPHANLPAETNAEVGSVPPLRGPTRHWGRWITAHPSTVEKAVTHPSQTNTYSR